VPLHLEPAITGRYLKTLLFLHLHLNYAIAMKYVIIIVRVLLGLLFAVFGSNAFLHFIPMPEMHGDADTFIGALAHSGYIYVIAALQVVGGLCLLIHPRLVAPGLILLGPVIVNIILYHIFMEPSGLGMAAIIGVLSMFLLWVYRYKFPAIFNP
jgi:putative oxidoreductase